MDNADAPVLGAILDAISSLVFLVDSDVRVQSVNRAARSHLGKDLVNFLRDRMGEILICIHSTDAPGGCGRSHVCQDCVVRNCVNQVVAGAEVVHDRGALCLQIGGKVQQLNFSVTAAGLHFEGRKMVTIQVVLT
jgi:PAS domain-containing protein